MFPLYVIRGKRPILIDCAILAKAQEIALRLRSFLGRERIALALLTHSHYDHVGACSLLQQEHGFEIAASLRTREILASDKAIAFIDDLNQKFKTILNDHSASAFSKPERVRGLQENEVLDLDDGRTITVYDTPGHTRCSISFLLLPERILFPGDAAGVVEKNGKIKPLFLSCYSHYERSLAKLLALEANVLALAHNTPVQGSAAVRKFLQESLDETRALKETILAHLEQTNDFDLIARQLLDRDYLSPTIMGPREALLINLTAMVKSIYHEFVKPV